MKKSILFVLCVIFAFAIVACNPTVIGSDNSTSTVTYYTVSFDTNERYKECKRK